MQYYIIKKKFINSIFKSDYCSFRKTACATFSEVEYKLMKTITSDRFFETAYLAIAFIKM